MTPTLGMQLRALRLGYGWTGSSFLRISGSGPFKCEFRPCELIPNTDRPHSSHRCWWGFGDRLDMGLWAGVALFSVRAKRHFIVWVGDDGMPA